MAQDSQDLSELDAPAPAPSAAPANDALPDIEARAFNVEVSRISTSKQIYLFAAPIEEPKVGRILLLKKNDSPVMAFRVLRTYDEKKQFAAKKVFKYEGSQDLSPKDSFVAIEKVADLAPVAATPQDQADLKELESEFDALEKEPVPSDRPKLGPTGSDPGLDDPSLDAELNSGDVPPTAPSGKLPAVNAYDPELDAGSSPPPEGAVDSEAAKSNPSDSLINAAIEDPQEQSLMVIEETTPLDTTHHSLTGGIIAFQNTPSTSGERYNGAGGIRYGFTLGHMILLRKPSLQDSLTFEGGVYLHKTLNYRVLNDAYTVMPITLNARYNILFSENLGMFLYGGIVQHRVLGSAQGTDEGIAALSTTIPMAGMGMLFRIGPNWDARVDFGYDSFGAGLMLRF